MYPVGFNPAATSVALPQLDALQPSSSDSATNDDFTRMLAQFDEGTDATDGEEEPPPAGLDDGGLLGGLSSIATMDPNTMRALYHAGEPHTAAAVSAPASTTAASTSTGTTVNASGPVSTAAAGASTLGVDPTSMDSMLAELVKILRQLTDMLAKQIGGGAPTAPTTHATGGGSVDQECDEPVKSGPPMKHQPPMKHEPTKPVQIDPIVPVSPSPPTSTPIATPSVDVSAPVPVSSGSADLPPTPTT